MRPEQRIVVSSPLDELWDERGPIAASRSRALGRQEIAELLSSEAIQFVVADVGTHLRWIPVDDRLPSGSARSRSDLFRPTPRSSLLETIPMSTATSLRNGGVPPGSRRSSCSSAITDDAPAV
jgi:hypothetical protein